MLQRCRNGVTSVEYDPNRTAFISLVKYADGDRRYVLATDGVKVGTKIIASAETETLKQETVYR